MFQEGLVGTSLLYRFTLFGQKEHVETGMNKTYSDHPVRYLTVVNSKEEAHQANLLISSLRRFGGRLGENCAVWLFLTDMKLSKDFSDGRDITLFPLEIDPDFRHYPLVEKVFACAQAEEMTGTEDRSLVWLNLDCLIINPPVLFELDGHYDAAFRPVHIRNVGSLASEPLDVYWQTVYQMVGIDRVPYTVESFVDTQIIRPYFNTHCFSINPKKGILKSWRECFTKLLLDKEFQTFSCQDDLHQIFLHQVVLSALVTKSVEQKRICLLPPGYSYPLHLQEKLPVSKRAKSLNQLVCLVYEDTTLLDGIDIQEPVISWLRNNRSTNS